MTLSIFVILPYSTKMSMMTSTIFGWFVSPMGSDYIFLGDLGRFDWPLLGCRELGCSIGCVSSLWMTSCCADVDGNVGVSFSLSIYTLYKGSFSVLEFLFLFRVLFSQQRLCARALWWRKRYLLCAWDCNSVSEWLDDCMGLVKCIFVYLIVWLSSHCVPFNAK